MFRKENLPSYEGINMVLFIKLLVKELTAKPITEDLGNVVKNKLLTYLTQISYFFSYKTEFVSFQNIPKNLDLS